MRIAFDHQIFALQPYGGISRYFVRVAEELAAMDATCVSINATLHCNRHLAERQQMFPGGTFLENANPIALRLIAPVNRYRANRDVAQFQPDILHETYYGRVPVKAPGAARILTVYDMIHEHFPDDFSFRDRTSVLKRKAVARADHIIAISHSTKRDLCELFGVREEKVSVVHLGFEHFKGDGAGAEFSSGAAPFILYVGNRGGYKNFAGLLRSVSSSSRLKREADIVAFGGGGFTDDEKALIRDLGFRDRQVRQVSGSDEVLGQLYRAAAVFVYPSLYEGFGLPPLEAMAHDCPVVSSNTSSLPEVVGEAGVYFDPEDEQSLVHAIEEVLSDDRLRIALVERGRERLNHFSWHRCAEQTRDVYQQVLG